MKQPTTRTHLASVPTALILLLIIMAASALSASAAGTWYGNANGNGWATNAAYNSSYGRGTDYYGTTYGSDSGYSWWYRQANSTWKNANNWSTNPTPAPSPKSTTTQPPTSSSNYGSNTGILSADEARSYQLINQARQQNGLAPLALNPTLVKVAREKAQDMADKGYFGHYSPTYGSPYDHLQANGVAYRWAGENIAEMDSVDSAHAAFMQSSGHRANILSSAYTQVGVGVVRRGRTVYIAQEFIKPAGQ